MAVKIFSHPQNIEALRNQFEKEKDCGPRGLMYATHWCGIEFVADPRLPIDTWTGRYILPDGQIVKKSEIRIRTRWIDYGPDDLEWLLYAGIVTEERTILFHKVDTLDFAAAYDPAPIIHDRRVFTGMAS